jgi:hypothetical protein
VIGGLQTYTKNASYVGLSRARGVTRAFVLADDQERDVTPRALAKQMTRR